MELGIKVKFSFLEFMSIISEIRNPRFPNLG
jgi:hypothetical protein